VAGSGTTAVRGFPCPLRPRSRGSVSLLMCTWSARHRDGSGEPFARCSAPFAVIHARRCWCTDHEWIVTTDVGTRIHAPNGPGSTSGRSPIAFLLAQPPTRFTTHSSRSCSKGPCRCVVSEQMGYSSTPINEQVFSHVTARLLEAAGAAVHRALDRKQFTCLCGVEVAANEVSDRFTNVTTDLLVPAGLASRRHRWRTIPTCRVRRPGLRAYRRRPAVRPTSRALGSAEVFARHEVADHFCSLNPAASPTKSSREEPVSVAFRACPAGSGRADARRRGGSAPGPRWHRTSEL
jgi:hypothetical protein